MSGMKKIARREVTLAVLLSSTAGYLDAVGYVVLGGFFVSFMSGNTTELATAFGESRWGTVGFVATLIGSFFAGSVLGAVLARIWDGRTTVLAGTTLLVALTAILDLFVHSDVPVMVLLPLAMGAINATFLTSGEATIGLTYMTGALVKAGQLLVDAFCGGSPTVWIRHLALWASLLIGGILGVLMVHRVGLGGALWPIVALLAALTVIVAVTRFRLGRFALRHQPKPVHEIRILGPDNGDS